MTSTNRGVPESVRSDRPRRDGAGGPAPANAAPIAERTHAPPVPGTLIDALRSHAAGREDAPALLHRDDTWTYGRLASRVDDIAVALTELDVAGRPVIVFADRGPDTTAAMLGVMAAGGISTPVDTAATAAWLGEIVEDARPAALITDSEHRHLVPEPGVPVLVANELTSSRGGPTPPVPGPENPAYIIYTSGSTGRPKGVIVEHAQLSAYVENFAPFYGITETSRTVQFHALSFDASVEDLFLPLACGGSVVHLDPESLSTIDRFLAWCGENGVTHLSLPTAFFHEIVNGLVDGATWPAAIGTVMFGGEAARAAAIRSWTDILGDRVRLLNAYGPTEVTVVCTAADLTASRPDGPVPIGRAVGTNRAHVLDEDGFPVRAGEEGELVMAGPQVARGYLGRAELTAERFPPDRFAGPEGARMYRTGDLVRIAPDGELLYLGRIDRQVKIRGYRIELQAVEDVVRRHPAVRDCVVSVREAGADTVRLVGYVVPADSRATVDLDAVREALTDELPPFMVPEALAVIDRIPLTTSGKIDERALPDPGQGGAARLDDQEPDIAGVPDEVAADVRRIWAGVLERTDIGARAGFFELGGHSILAIRMLSAIRRELGVELGLEQLFENDTLERFTRLVASTAAGSHAPLLPDHPAPSVGEAHPLSPAQERMWVIHRLDPTSVAYLIPEVTALEGDLEIDVLASAYASLAERHATLRTRYVEVDGTPQQIVDPPGEAPFQYFDVSDTDDPEAEAHRLTEHWRRVPVDLERGPVWRVVVVRIAPDRHLLLTVVHHIASDGESHEVSSEEVSELYRAALEGRPPSLPDPGLEYTEYARRQRRLLASGELDDQREWWRRRLHGVPPLDLPGDRPRPAVRSMEGATVRFAIPGADQASLQALATRCRATQLMIGLALFSAFVHRTTGAERFVVGVPSSDREGPEMENVVGLFVNSLPVVVEPRADMSFADLVQATRESAVASYARRAVPFDEIVRSTLTRRDPARNPVFDVMVQYGILARGTPLDLPGVTATSLPDDGDGADLDLSVELDVADGGLVGSITYRSDLFDPTTVDRMIDQLASLTAAALGDPDMRLSELPLLDAEHERRVLEGFGGADRVTAEHAPDLVSELIARAGEDPDLPVVHDADGTVTARGDLLQQTARLAAAIRESGVDEGDVVAAVVPPGGDLVAAQYAVLAVGAAFLPLDPRFPDAWIGHAIASAGARIAIAGDAVQVEGIPIIAPGTDHPTGTLAPVAADSGSTACLLYVSGPAPRPQFTPISRLGLARSATSARHLIAPGEGDVVALASPAVAGTMLGELLATVGSGASVAFLPDDATSPDRLVAFLADSRVTIAHLPAHVWVPLAHRVLDGLDLPTTLHTVSVEVGTERAELLTAWRSRFPGRTLPTYRSGGIPGPLAAAEPHGRRPDRLRPLPGSALYVVDRHGRPTPIGVPGRVHVGGELIPTDDAPEDVGGRVIAAPYRDDRMVPTGDVARWTVDGTLDLMEIDDLRIDAGGLLVDLRHIGHALSAHPKIDQAEVHVTESGSVRAVVTSRSVLPERRELVEFLADELPEEAIPAEIVAGSAILEGGDRAPSGTLTTTERRDPLLESMCHLWTEVLGRPAGPDSDFFELGGSSLLAIRLLSLLERRHSISLPLTAVFDNPTPAKLAWECRGSGGARDARVFSISDGPGPELFCFNPGGGGFSLYRPLGIRLAGERGLVGVLARGADGLQPPDRDVRRIAEHWADVILDHTGGRDIHLLGYSDGGVKAFETAREIERRGGEPAFLGVIDTFLPAPHASNRTLPSIGREFVSDGVGAGVEATWSELRSYLGRARHAPRWHLLRALDRRLPPDQILRRLNHASDIAFRRYRYDGGSVTTPITLFRATWHGDDHRPELSWRQATTGGVDVVDVPGRHSLTDAIVDEPHVQYLAKAMLEAIGDVESR